MKQFIACIMLLLICSCGYAEGADPSAVYEFARNYDAESIVQNAYESAVQGSAGAWQDLLAWLKDKALESIETALLQAASLAAPIFLLGLIQSGMTTSNGGGEGARFLLRLMLISGFSEIALRSLEASGECIYSAKCLGDVIAPAVTALFVSMGMTGTSSLVSPAGALAGGVAEGIFMNFGLPLCRIALCIAIAGSLSEAIDLKRVTQLLKKLANWGAGLVTMLFTALVAIQGNVTETLDGVGIRTAKFAVDSASSVIGNGVSDAWESYVSGMLITKNALGISGMVSLAAAGLKPVVLCTAAMLVLNLAGALLDLFGEHDVARAAVQIGGICQMALSLATAALVIVTVLLGAAMSAGNSFVA